MTLVFLLAIATAPPTSASLVGIWDAQRRYPAGSSPVRHGDYLVQPGNADDSSPIAWHGAPEQDVQHFELFIQAAPGDTLTAFVRNPEENAGAFIGLRTVVSSGDTIRMQHAGRPDIVGSRSRNPDAITFDDSAFSGRLTFTRAQPTRAPTPYRYRAPTSDGDGWKLGTLVAASIDETAIGESSTASSGQRQACAPPTSRAC